ncbi:hypothetical protein Sdiek2_2511, partial [Sulfurospirillum diekertiae]
HHGCYVCKWCGQFSGLWVVFDVV